MITSIIYFHKLNKNIKINFKYLLLFLHFLYNNYKFLVKNFYIIKIKENIIKIKKGIEINYIS